MVYIYLKVMPNGAINMQFLFIEINDKLIMRLFCSRICQSNVGHYVLQLNVNLKLRQHPAIYNNYRLHHCSTLQYNNTI